MPKLIDDFQGQVATYFQQLILATAYLHIGGRYIATASADTSVALTLAPDIKTEPLYLRELMPHSSAVAQGIAELFQTKAISAWFDLLVNLFAQFATAHLDDVKRFPELKKRTARIDFSLKTDMKSQVQEGLIADFAFEKYSERIKVINRILEPDAVHDSELSIIKKHVLIRNSIQHHGSRVYPDMLKELGSPHLQVLYQEGTSKKLSPGEAIQLFVPELDHLKGALVRITNAWRARVA